MTTSTPESGQPNPQELIARDLRAYLKPDMSYPSPLPAELAAWYCYTVDGGHSIVVALDFDQLGTNPSREDLEGALCPAPVKSVQRASWRMLDGFPVCKLPYDRTLGLVTPEAETEW